MRRGDGWLSAAGVADEALRGLCDDRREAFDVRLERWWDDIVDGLSQVYTAAEVDRLLPRLVRRSAQAYRERDPGLLRLDSARTLRPDWFQSPRMLGYAAYTERFAGDLAGVRERIPYLRELGVCYLHLLPLLKPREGDNDGGYAVADYKTVRPDLGTMDGLQSLACALRGEGISLVLDLVLNHVAEEHPWVVAARAGDERYRRYFYVYPDRVEPDAFEQTLPEVFPDFAPGSFTWDDQVGGWVWTTFNSWQWDLNWSNPDVFFEFADIVLFLANVGVEVLRLDAIAFLWKRLGTNCQNQPEVHAITQALRAVARLACPAVAFKAEAIVAPDDVVQYLGQDRYYGKVSDLAYQNNLMVQVWSMLASGDVRLTARAMTSPPPVPTTTAWVTYVRCHDDIGWAVGDAAAAAVGLSGFDHRRFLADFYAGQFPDSFARGLMFQANELTGDRRTSGTTASLAGLELAVESGDEEAIVDAIARIRLAYAVILGWGGVPVIWMGDEIGLLNDPDWAAEPGHEGDNRWAHRPRMDWAAAGRRHDPATTQSRIFAELSAMARVRAGLPHLHAAVQPEVLEVSDPGVLAVLRRHPLGPFVGVYNVTGSWRPYPVQLLSRRGLFHPVDALTGHPMHTGQDGQAWFAPWAAHWFVNR